MKKYEITVAHPYQKDRAQRNQRIERADGQPVDDLLENDLHSSSSLRFYLKILIQTIWRPQFFLDHRPCRDKKALPPDLPER